MAGIGLSTTAPELLQDPSDISEAHSSSVLADEGDALHGISSEKDTLCMASGRVIKKDKQGAALQATQRCKCCRHHSIVDELPAFVQLHGAGESPRQRAAARCPLCHAALAAQ